MSTFSISLAQQLGNLAINHKWRDHNLLLHQVNVEFNMEQCLSNHLTSAMQLGPINLGQPIRLQYVRP